MPSLSRISIQRQSVFLPIDFDGSPPKAVDVAVYPEEDDNVKVLGRGGQVWFARIISSDDQNHKASLKWFTETRLTGLYTLSNQEDIVPWRSILGYAHMIRVMGGYRIEED